VDPTQGSRGTGQPTRRWNTRRYRFTGDLASVTDPRPGHVLPSLMQVAPEEGETAARNLDAELKGRPLETFTFRDRGLVVSVRTSREVADIADITTGGWPHLAKDVIEWEYSQSVRHRRGWDPVPG
jgi:NADH:ubiquinone reductase (H+-translocating)